jgi:hypothetical protein
MRASQFVLRHSGRNQISDRLRYFLPANAAVHVTPPKQETVFAIFQMLDLVKCQTKFLGKYIGKYDEVVDTVEQLDTFLIASKARRLPQILDNGGIGENVLFVNG